MSKSVESSRRDDLSSSISSKDNLSNSSKDNQPGFNSSNAALIEEQNVHTLLRYFGKNWT